MTSDAPKEAFVWIWLPEATLPVVAGRLEVRNGLYTFNYGRSYLEHPGARAISRPSCRQLDDLRSGQIAICAASSHSGPGLFQPTLSQPVATIVDAAPTSVGQIADPRQRKMFILDPGTAACSG